MTKAGALLTLSILFVLAGATYAAGEGGTGTGKDGESLYHRFCLKCHGENGSGTKKGPPLVHKIYEPSHHSDVSFRFAMERGVTAHHWNFGDMPKIGGVSQAEAEEIIKYVRGLQKAAGIF